ncbi:MAG TPA: DUF885 domain-containing protein [Roseiflexaceae bacterium]|nr:DUF885 domain-containing protein [Roseiflexaceae bacterium]
MTHAPAFQNWLDAFFASYYRHRPVNATFVGVHDYDDRLPDFSEQGIAAVQSDMAALLQQLGVLPDEPLRAAETLDRRLAEGFLRIQQWEYDSLHFARGNPCVYTGEAAFGVLSLLRRPFAPLQERLAHAAARMDAIPALLEQGQANVRQAPRAWTDKAIDECHGLLALLQEGIPQLMHENGMDDARVSDAAERASKAVTAFQQYLENELRQHASEQIACGSEAFELYLRHGHFLSQSADEIAAHAEATIAECAADLAAQAREFGADDWRAVLAMQADHHPTTEQYLDQYGKVWDACRATAEAHDLVTWPEYPIRYVPRPRWVRSAAPHLYFLFYHSPAPFDRLPEVEYLVTPIEPSMPADEQERLLRATNDSVIKLNHVVHHGALGHHVQNYYAFRAESRIGQMAAVDCASRVAMFCAGTMAEGWACYATDLMGEVGFMTPLERFGERHGRLRMAARALADVRLHHGQWSLEDAARFYQEQVGMPAAAARNEAVKNSMFPATATMYLMGTDAIHALRHAMEARPDFNLRHFHDQLLSFGSVPVALIAEAMHGV